MFVGHQAAVAAASVEIPMAHVLAEAAQVVQGVREMVVHHVNPAVHVEVGRQIFPEPLRFLELR